MKLCVLWLTTMKERDYCDTMKEAWEWRYEWHDKGLVDMHLIRTNDGSIDIVVTNLSVRNKEHDEGENKTKRHNDVTYEEDAQCFDLWEKYIRVCIIYIY